MNGFEILPSAGGGSDPLKLDLTGGTMTGQLVLTAAADGALKVTPTWNNGAVSFVGIFERVTNTASGANSCLIDLGTVASGSLFKVDKSSFVYLNGDASPTISRRSDVNMLMLHEAKDGIEGVVGIGSKAWHYGINISSEAFLCWTNDTPAATRDITFSRYEAGILAFLSSGTTGAAIQRYVQAAPSVPPAGCMREWVESSGGKLRFMVQFPTGAAQQIAIEP